MNQTLVKLIAGALLVSTTLCFAEVKPAAIVAAARSQIGVTVSYDPAYRKLAYPGGDVPKETGVCSDVVIRALREQDLDLQKLVHEDMAANFKAYPQKWGLKKPDSNIDHRRVPNLMAWFSRQGFARSKSTKAQDFAAGDIVAWDLGKGILHIGIVADHQSATGTPLIIHNIGRGAQEEDILFQFEIVGHYRLK